MLVIKPTTVVSSANLMIQLEACMAKQSWVNREYRRGLSTHPFGAPVGWPVSKSSTQLHRAELRPRASTLIMSLEGTMVLNAEL